MRSLFSPTARAARAIPGALALLVLVLTLAAPAWATTVERVVSPGGIEAWLVEAHEIPILSVSVAFRGGADTDPAGKEGLANMVSGLLDEGAGDLDSQAYQTRIEDLAIKLGFDAGLDTFGADMKTLAKNTDEAFRLLSLALTEPRFDARPVARIRSQIQVGLARQASDPDYIARRAWFAAAFPDHPYGRPTSGTPKSVAAITTDDLRAFMRRSIARDRMVIGVVGDITPERLAPLLDATFGALPEKGAVLDIPHATPQAPGRVIVKKRDIPQSIVIFGGEGIRRDDPDYYAAYVMNYILGGGGFSSRLTNEVREKRGLAYGVYSYLSPLDHAELFLGRVATENSRVAESIRVIRAQIARMRDDGATKTEIADAKTYLTGSFPLRLDTNDKIAGMLIGIQLEKLGIDYLDKRNGYIKAVTLADVNRMAAKILKPKALEIVIVGEPEGIKPTD